MPYFNQALETMPREELHALQFQKLRRVLDQIDGKNRFYTEKFNSDGITPNDLQSLEDLSLFPYTSKHELVQAQAEAPPFGTNATYPESKYIRYHRTSGTTGVPLNVIDTKESWDWWGDCWAYVLTAAGVTAEDRVFLPFSFGPFIGFWSVVGGAEKIGAMLITGGGHNSQQRLRIMRDMKTTVLCCTPTYALRLAEVARETNFDLTDIPIRITIHAGEPGANIPTTKARIEETWSAKCFDHAGASEVGPYSFECEHQPGGIHAIESEFIIEILDPKSGNPSLPGEPGELVITNLGRIGFPVIRYRTGDLVEFSEDPCDCGRTFGLFKGGVIGRSDDMVIVRGVNIFPGAIENILREFKEVEEFRAEVIKHREMTDLVIDVELNNGANKAASQKNIYNAFHYALGLRTKINIVQSGSLPRYEFKANRFSISEDIS